MILYFLLVNYLFAKSYKEQYQISSRAVYIRMRIYLYEMYLLALKSTVFTTFLASSQTVLLVSHV